MSPDRTGKLVLISLASALALTTAFAHDDEDDDARRAEGSPPTAADAADRLLARLRYVRADYPNAVVDGQVVEAEEYEEQVELLEDAIALAGPLPLSTATRTAIGGIGAAVSRRAPAVEVTSACNAVLARLSEELWLEIDAPDPARLGDGAALYAANCASCHGARGEGPSADLVLAPAPIAFVDASVAAGLSPRRVYEAVTFGVPETAMVARADTLSEPERWSLAFYVAGIGAGTPTAPTTKTGSTTGATAAPAVPSRTLEDLAESTNAALASAAPTGVPAAQAVAAWRGPALADAARSPWLAMRADTRAWLTADAAGADEAAAAAALARLESRWKIQRKHVAATDRRLATSVDTALSALTTTRGSAPRARDAARALEVSLAEVERALR